jgi:hypothetical protein
MAWDAARDSQARPGAGDTPPGASSGPNPLQVNDDGLLAAFNRGVTDDRGPNSLNEDSYLTPAEGGLPSTATPPEPPTPSDSYTATSYQYPTPREHGTLGF